MIYVKLSACDETSRRKRGTIIFGARTLPELAKECRLFIEYHEIEPDHWTGGRIEDGAGNYIGHIDHGGDLLVA